MCHYSFRKSARGEASGYIFCKLIRQKVNGGQLIDYQIQLYCIRLIEAELSSLDEKMQQSAFCVYINDYDFAYVQAELKKKIMKDSSKHPINYFCLYA